MNFITQGLSVKNIKLIMYVDINTKPFKNLIYGRNVKFGQSSPDPVKISTLPILVSAVAMVQVLPGCISLPRWQQIW